MAHRTQENILFRLPVYYKKDIIPEIELILRVRSESVCPKHRHPLCVGTLQESPDCVFFPILEALQTHHLGFIGGLLHELGVIKLVAIGD